MNTNDNATILATMAATTRDLRESVRNHDRPSIQTIEYRALTEISLGIRLAQVVVGAWGPVADGDDPYCDLTASELDEIMEESGERLMHWPADPDFDSAKLDRSRVDREYLRLTAGDRQFLIQEDVDGGYGDDGSRCRMSYHLRLCGDGGGHTLVAPDESVHFVAPATMRAAQAAYDAASEPFDGCA